MAISRIRQNDRSKIERQILELRESEVKREQLLEKLQEKTKELEQIVYIASHDLRSPLVNIQGFTKELEHSIEEMREITNNGEVPQPVKEKLAVYMEEDIPESLNFVLAGTAKIDSLLSGLLRLSRLGRAALEIQNINMNELLKDISNALEFTLKNSRINLEVALLPNCQGDKTQINQVFSNLIYNAIKYHNPERPCHIRITGKIENDQTIFCVEDNGIGIAEEHQEKIFEIFQRVNPVNSTGEGLGLSIVKKILDRHSGKVWVESEIGEGSKFFVSLPITEERKLQYANTGSSNTHS
jgi:signal transduction histidine kinase